MACVVVGALLAPGNTILAGIVRVWVLASGAVGKTLVS